MTLLKYVTLLMLNAIPDLGTVRRDFLDPALIIEFPELKPEM